MGRTAVNHSVRANGTVTLGPAGVLGRAGPGVVLALPLLLVLAAWSYWPALTDLFTAWQSDDDYSAGQLVPLVAALLFWHERKSLRQQPWRPCWSGGIGLLVLAEVVRGGGFVFLRPSVERYALVLMVAGLVLLVAGRHVFRRVAWILAFLFLMVPLPSLLHNLISAPLRRVATTGSVVLLEAVGVPVAQEGNVVVLNGNMPLAVAEACSGLRMLTAFLIVAAFIAYMIKRPRWQKGVLLASSIPVAVICNMIRIFATALLMLYVSAEMAQKFFHDFAGYVMMPAAVMLLFGAIGLMDRLVLPEPGPDRPAGPKTIVRRRPVASRSG